ncbi:hypothetical protein [Coleofasciculus chthonoplastes]|uniref:hypothetical protein n=1 Tax=Coleofasciculus chthonoplastes TaxID=64178 RepID=UPI0032FAE2C7
MAILQLQDGTTYTQLNDITQELAALNVKLNHWSVGDNSEIHRLLAQTLTDEEKAQITTTEGWVPEYTGTEINFEA